MDDIWARSFRSEIGVDDDEEEDWFGEEEESGEGDPLTREQQEIRAANLTEREDEKDIVIKKNPW